MGFDQNNIYEFYINYYSDINCSGSFATNAAAGDASYGIQVGTGTTANSTSTYALASQIANGTSSGQLSYERHTYALNPSGTIAIVTRSFSNNSCASITVSEVGLVWKSNTNGYTFMMLRDVLSSPLTVANGSVLTAQYTISITVS